MNRRSFLGTVAGAVASPVAVPTCVVVASMYRGADGRIVWPPVTLTDAQRAAAYQAFGRREWSRFKAALVARARR
jgi:hypothetical protein